MTNLVFFFLFQYLKDEGVLLSAEGGLATTIAEVSTTNVEYFI